MAEKQNPLTKEEFYLLLGKIASELELKFGRPALETIKESTQKHYGTFDEGDIEKYNLRQYSKLAQHRAKELGVEVGYRREELLERLKANPDKNAGDIITSMLAEDYGLQNSEKDSQQLSNDAAESTNKADDLMKMFFRSSPLLALFLMIMKSLNERPDRSVNEQIKDNMEMETVVHRISSKTEDQKKSYTVDRTIPEDQLKEFHEMGKSLREKGATTFDMLYDNIKEQERQQDRSQSNGMGLG